MAKAALDCAIWDLYAKENGISVSKALAAQKTKLRLASVLAIQGIPMI